MKVNFFNRYYYPNQISIEKVFSILKLEMELQGIAIKQYTNPYLLTPIGILKALFYFKSKQSKINHVTGDITWCSFLLKSKSTIITIHDLGGLTYLNGIKRKLFFLWWIYLPVRNSKFVTVISNKTKRDIVRLMPSAANKIKVIHNCYTSPINESNKNKWNEIPEILIVGTRENKNIERIISALVGFKCLVTIIGKLTVKQNEILLKSGIDFQNFEFLTDEELVKLYKKSDILTFISKFEGFGLPILEANAQNCVVVTSNIEPMIEVADNSAYFVDPYDIEDIRNGIIEVWSNTELRNQLIINGKENLKRFEIKKITQEYISLYKQI